MKIEISLTTDNGEKYYGKAVLSKVKKSTTKSTTKKISTKPKRNSLGSAILDLIDENFFKTPKNLKQITEQLKANTVFYPRTAYPDALFRLIKNKKLRRFKEGTKWVYVKYG